ncbi:transcriptional regulator BolA [Corallincola spongiicola]|uniref:Transcriptional regulator BolA n=1 Tax=Corallincola spongiicola TaxID=2520508 RepID=A0ABY1WS49_9GAMM|nr:transcriptional regulator BolA [Corallincola spongiicola]TAA47551.1 transcriptional regulator BolA [Corallincola spongiicola]
MSVQNTIEKKLLQRFAPVHLEVINESGNHNVPAGAESHFKVVIVSAQFEGNRLLARHRSVNETLAQELDGQIHALAMHTYTQSEWESNFGDIPNSPKCMGGSSTA